MTTEYVDMMILTTAATFFLSVLSLPKRGNGSHQSVYLVHDGQAFVTSNGAGNDDNSHF